MTQREFDWTSFDSLIVTLVYQLYLLENEQLLEAQLHLYTCIQYVCVHVQ